MLLEAEIVFVGGGRFVRILEGKKHTLYRLSEKGSRYLKPAEKWTADVRLADGNRKRCRFSADKDAAAVTLSELLKRVENEKAAKKLRIDLRTAAIPFKITGHEGEEARDFHALRNCTISNAIRADSKRAMTLARHSDPKLTTARYARTRLHDLGSLVNKLPGSKGPEAERLRMTGTDGDTAASDKRNTISGAANGGNGRLRLRMNEETEVMEPTATGSLNRLISNGNEGVLGCIGKEEDERKAKPPARLELATYALRKRRSTN